MLLMFFPNVFLKLQAEEVFFVFYILLFYYEGNYGYRPGGSVGGVGGNSDMEG